MHLSNWLALDAAMKVSLDILQRVYEALQDQGDGSNEAFKETLDPESHLYFVDAFDMPLWHWSVERGTFERSVVQIPCYSNNTYKDTLSELLVL